MNDKTNPVQPRTKPLDWSKDPANKKKRAAQKRIKPGADKPAPPVPGAGAGDSRDD